MRTAGFFSAVLLVFAPLLVNVPRVQAKPQAGPVVPLVIETDGKADVALFPLEKAKLGLIEVAGYFRLARPLPARLLFLSSSQFAARSKASWASAIFIDGKILIPADRKILNDEFELERIIRHEYVHAVTADLTKYSCPAWLDEGLAQLMEGVERPDLEMTVGNWLRNNKLIPFSDLGKGFLSLPRTRARLAYAQSYVAAKWLVENHGYSPIIRFFSFLQRRRSRPFERAFGMSLQEFQARLTYRYSSQAHPALPVSPPVMLPDAGQEKPFVRAKSDGKG